MVVYVDTSAWIALSDRKDPYHAAAARCAAVLSERNERLVTGRHSLVEFGDGLARHVGQRVAAATLERMTQGSQLLVEDSDAHWTAALDIFRSRTDWEVDLSDCLSFALMAHHGILHAFTFDTDFAKAGFALVGKALPS